jgi:hypothetical protein
MPVNPKQKVYASFPDTGLGNKLLIWAKAFVFAQKHRLEFFCAPWWGIHVGSWIRNEKQKRLYLGYFKEDSWMKRIRLLFFQRRAQVIDEPATLVDTAVVLYRFKTVVTSADYFECIKPYRQEVKEALYGMLQPALRQELESMVAPVIGVHIRRGDFKFGSTLTPLSFFIDSIRAIRHAHGRELPVTVFTDAYADELSELLALPAVSISAAKADIVDILLLSRSKICVLSISSTFSFWGGFLSEGIVLLHPDEWHPTLRPGNVNALHYEGRFNPAIEMEPALLQQIKEISIS